MSSVFPAKSQAHVALQPCHPEAVYGLHLTLVNMAWDKIKTSCNSKQVPDHSPKRARRRQNLREIPGTGK